MLQLENRELQKQWTWEPTMAESLILSLLDPDDVVRRAGKILLEHLSCECLLTSGLKFLCSSSSSLFAVLAGLRYVFRLVHVCPITDSFCSLHHAFFVTGKLLKELVRSPVLSSLNPLEHSKYGNFSSQGGFLLQPSIEHISSDPSDPILNSMDTKSWERFSCLLSQAMWPSVLKCLVEGKKRIDSMKCQMTCVRLLETLPAVYERLILSSSEESRNMLPVVPISSDFKWLSDLVDWGRSSLVVVIRHWKQCMLAVLNIIKRSCGFSTESMINIIEKQISTDAVPVSNLQKKILGLAVSLAQLVSINENSQIPKQKSVAFEPSSMQKVLDADTSLCFSSGPKEEHIEKELIVLSDDESEKVVSSEISASCCINSSLLPFHETSHLPTDKSLLSDGQSNSMVGNSTFDVPEPFPSGIFIEDDLPSSKDKKDELGFSKAGNTECVFDKNGDSHMDLEDPGSSLVKSSHNSNVHHNDQSFAEVISTSVAKTDMLPRKADAMIQALVHDDINDPLEAALHSTNSRQPVVTKLSTLAPKRKVIQLQLPANNKSSSLSRADISSRRLKPPKLDDWYRLILEMDYFTMVGLNSINAEEKFASSLKEVPLRFESADQYVKIFRPLVLEEFKAQLQNSFLESSVEDMHCGSLCIVSVERIDDFHIIRACPNEKESAASIVCMENDLVLLTKKPLESSVQSTHALGKVERREKSDKTFSLILVIRFYLQGSYSRLNKVKRLLIERSKWFLNRVMSITPQLREFQALSSLNEIPMLPIILNPVGHSHGHSVMNELSKLSQPMQKMLKSSFNGSQLQAISIAIRSKASKNFELSLIQGPPVHCLLYLRVPNTSGSNILTESTTAINGFLKPRAQLSNSAAVARAWQDAALAKQLIKDSEKNSLCTEYSCKERVLICAQSNAAVDELVSRVNDGICGNDGKMYTPFIVRVGNAKTVHSNSLPYFIDTLVEQRLAEEMSRAGNGDAGNDSCLDCSSSLRTKLEKLVERIQYCESKRAKSKDDVDVNSTCCDNTSKEDDMHEIPDSAIGAKLNILYREKKLIYQNLSIAQARERKASEESKALKHKIRKSILREAEIVVTTLSGCGGDLYGVCYESASASLSGKFFEQSLFDVVLIDEAAQALEPATLIPLQLLKSNGAKCVMVGDPKQLPATVLSSVASKFLYACSMFERLQRAGHPVIMLTEQYRMHPEICSFPSLHFYDKKLLNGIDMESKSAKFHQHVYLGPYMFFDIADGHENHGKGSSSLSLYNEAEVEAAISIMRFLRKRYVSEFTSKKIGIITPYKSQLHLLRSRFSSVFGPGTMSDMEFNTVDGFQGREVDILVLSTVRSSAHISRSTGSSSRNIGFVADVRRMNVALTRAKFSLWIVGNANTLQTNPHWSALVQNAKERNLFLSILQPYESFLEQGSSFSERNSCPSSQVRKADTAESSCNFEQDRKNGKGDHRKKTKLLGEKTMLHPTNRSRDCEPATSMGTQRMANDKHGRLNSSRTVSHEDAASKLQKQKDKVGSSKNSSQKIQKGNKEGSKTIQSDALFDADCGLGASMDDKANHGLSEHDVCTKPCESIASGLLSSDKAQKGKMEKSRSSDDRSAAKDLLATRKRQRDDIEALLPSALISSRKTGMLSNGAAVKKPPAATNVKSNSKTSKD
ncbi:hypothetical protein HPP92_017101 [Vanilla planifolia]|uniref:P-loop containing nucleoside triphosphate hydrolases superfamily protein n=1 Tax=Vanilla planifolia TaxID=51239 RepID=A0A835QGF1_VANPL|nr:hypothetical protein HPP92_017101 [Vanilla planifolia]